MNNNCIGCRSYTEDPLWFLKSINDNCYMNLPNKRDKCPCCRCIIKAMCSKECDNLMEYNKKFDYWTSGHKRVRRLEGDCAYV